MELPPEQKPDTYCREGKQVRIVLSYVVVVFFLCSIVALSSIYLVQEKVCPSGTRLEFNFNTASPFSFPANNKDLMVCVPLKKAPHG